MDKAILLAVAASVCTATASLCQRKGAKDNEAARFDARLVVRLARQPVWLLGIAAVLGAATGISWGFMAAVIKELSSHLGGGPGAVVSAWSLYVLIAAGAVTMLLASHALAAGPLAASQPGFTILDPLSASLLGVFLFGEHIRTDAAALAGEALALAVVIAGAAALSHSCLILGADGNPSCLPDE